MTDSKKEKETSETIMDKAYSATVDAVTGFGDGVMGWVDKRFKSPSLGLGDDDARTLKLEQRKTQYASFFAEGFKTMRYPENLFSQNQKNGVVFYIQVRKNSIAAANDSSGTAKSMANFMGMNTRGPQTENDTNINRSSADLEAITRINSGTGAVAGLMSGLAFFDANGPDGATAQKFVNKAAKVGVAAAAGIVGGKLIAGQNKDAETVFLQKVIQLHVPQAVVTQYQADWNSEELGLAGALSNRRASQVDFAEIGELGGRGIISAAANVPRAAGLVTQILAEQ